ncbi:MAG TPA: bZIP transcription factor [Planctomycetota bacterium]|nr:bZIP transcription factor [Planctomycetota bacterium]
MPDDFDFLPLESDGSTPAPEAAGDKQSGQNQARPPAGKPVPGQDANESDDDALLPKSILELMPPVPKQAPASRPPAAKAPAPPPPSPTPPAGGPPPTDQDATEEMLLVVPDGAEASKILEDLFPDTFNAPAAPKVPEADAAPAADQAEPLPPTPKGQGLDLDPRLLDLIPDSGPELALEPDTRQLPPLPAAPPAEQQAPAVVPEPAAAVQEPTAPPATDAAPVAEPPAPAEIQAPEGSPAPASPRKGFLSRMFGKLTGALTPEKPAAPAPEAVAEAPSAPLPAPASQAPAEDAPPEPPAELPMPEPTAQAPEPPPEPAPEEPATDIIPVKALTDSGLIAGPEAEAATILPDADQLEPITRAMPAADAPSTTPPEPMLEPDTRAMDTPVDLPAAGLLPPSTGIVALPEVAALSAPGPARPSAAESRDMDRMAHWCRALETRIESLSREKDALTADNERLKKKVSDLIAIIKGIEQAYLLGRLRRGQPLRGDLLPPTPPPAPAQTAQPAAWHERDTTRLDDRALRS